MISREASMLIAAALRRQRGVAERHYTSWTTWLDIRAEIGAILMKECSSFDRMQYHLLTELHEQDKHLNV